MHERQKCLSTKWATSAGPAEPALIEHCASECKARSLCTCFAISATYGGCFFGDRFAAGVYPQPDFTSYLGSAAFRAAQDAKSSDEISQARATAVQYGAHNREAPMLVMDQRVDFKSLDRDDLATVFDMRTDGSTTAVAVVPTFFEVPMLPVAVGPLEGVLHCEVVHAASDQSMSVGTAPFPSAETERLVVFYPQLRLLGEYKLDICVAYATHSAARCRTFSVHRHQQPCGRGFRTSCLETDGAQWTARSSYASFFVHGMSQMIAGCRSQVIIGANSIGADNI